MSHIERLVELMARLRGPGGCPWDLEQTHTSLQRYVLEEAYEVIEAIDDGSPDDLREELGDLLLQVVFHARIAEEEGRFDIQGVAEAINEKLVRRHPHVFGETEVEGSDEVLRNWDAIKSAEKREKGAPEPESALDGIPAALPALFRAWQIQKEAAKTGFDWRNIDEVLAKTREELAELEEAAAEGDADGIEEELGDLLFVLAGLGRVLDVEPENALRRATRKFEERFKAMEEQLRRDGGAPNDASLEEMEAVWERLRKAQSPEESA